MVFFAPRESVGLGKKLQRNKLQINKSAFKSYLNVTNFIRYEVPTHTCPLVVMGGHL